VFNQAVTFTSWQQAVSALEAAHGPMTAGQIALSARLELVIDPSVPAGVAAQLLRAAVGEPLGLPSSAEPSERQLEYLATLCSSVDCPFPDEPLVSTKALVGSWIDTMLGRRAMQALASLQPMPGDIVSRLDDPASVNELSSISADGRLNYRGGMGAGGRPHELQVVQRAGSGDPALRERAENLAVRRRAQLRAELPSGPQMAQLEPWLVSGPPELADVQELEAAIEAASDERPLQEVLTAHPELLGVLLGGTFGNAVRPSPRLHERFIPDFMLAEADSAGIHWTMVELESPRARILLSDGQLANKAREGVSQIRAWRQYLSDEIASARRPAPKGLGLVGLRPDRGCPEARRTLIGGPSRLVRSAWERDRR
jgi:hypothetical protein